MPNENRNLNNISNINNSKVINRIDQNVERMVEKFGSRPQSRDRVQSREKEQPQSKAINLNARKEMDDVSSKCREISERVEGLIRKKEQASKVTPLPNISDRRPGVNLQRVDSRNRILSANREGSSSRQKSYERPSSRQKSFEKAGGNNRSLDRGQPSSERSIERPNSRKRYAYQPSPRIRC